MRKYETRSPSDHLIVTSVSNDAVNNVVQSIHKKMIEKYGRHQVMREFAMQSCGGMSKEDEELSLQYQTDHLIENFRVDHHEDVVRLLEQRDKNEKRVKETRSIRVGLASVDEGRDLNRQLKKSTLAVASNYVMGSSVALVIRHAHQYRVKANGRRNPCPQGTQRSSLTFGGRQSRPLALTMGGEQGNLPRLPTDTSPGTFFDEVTDVIVDEASQLSTCWALALYMSSPGLQNVILIGDTKKLEPGCSFRKGTLLYEIASRSELGRVMGLENGRTLSLKNNHRSHLKIVDVLLKPIYGDAVTAASPMDKHSLAKEVMNIVNKPMDICPVLFVDYGYVPSSNGINEKEIEMVTQRVKIMTEAWKIPGNDIAIVCHSRQQLARLKQALEGQGIIGHFRTSVRVYTVDAFTGGEARIVMVLLSKTCHDNVNVKHALKSVSDSQRETVAVSRASDVIYLFGQWKMLVKTDFWGKFVDNIVQEHCLVDADWNPASEWHYKQLLDAKFRK